MPLNRLLSFLSALVVGLSAAAQAAPPPAGAQPQPPRVVMVRVGEKEVTVQDFMGYLQTNQGYLPGATNPAGRAKALKAMVSDMLIRQEIRRRGLVPKDKLEDDQAMLKAYRELSEREFPLPPPRPEEEARAYYQQHRLDYGIPPLRRISQIEFKIRKGITDAQKAELREKAAAALRRLESGEAFAKVAADLSDNKETRAQGGDLGFMPVTWLPEELRNLPKGQASGVIEQALALEILVWTDERPEMISPFEEVKSRVATRMQQEAQDRAKDLYLAKLTAKTPVTIVQEEYKPLFPKGMFPGGEAAPAAQGS